MNDYIGEYYSRAWVRRNILRQTDRDMEEQDKQIDKERELGVIPPKSSEGMGF